MIFVEVIFEIRSTLIIIVVLFSIMSLNLDSYLIMFMHFELVIILYC